jgi:hypothetical protein
MDATTRRLKIFGTVCHVLVGGLMLLACSGKAFGFAPSQVVETLNTYGLGDQIRVIGAGGLAAAILLLIPRTSRAGSLVTSAYWGGAICIHMAHHESVVLQSVLLLLTWTGAVFRFPEPFLASAPPTQLARAEADAALA